MAKIKITGNDIISVLRGKIGYFSGDDIYDRGGEKIGYYDGNDVKDSDGRKIGYLEGSELYDEKGRRVATHERINQEIQGSADLMMKSAIYLLFLD